MSRLRLVPPPDTLAGAELAHVEFCGIESPVEHTPFTIGREGDVAVDESNRFLHREFLTLDRCGDVWTLANAGTQLSARVSDGAGRTDTYLAPGGIVPLVTRDTTVRFSAGPTTYELTVHLPGPAVIRPPIPGRGQAPNLRDADATMGRVTLSPEQLLVVLVLAETVLVTGHHAAAGLPSNADAAARLGWTVTKFNRKLDTVCRKLTECGVRGLRGGPLRLATTRRARLVEYAIAAQLVTVRDLHLLPPRQLASSGGAAQGE